jgi:hypothetical protein
MNVDDDDEVRFVLDQLDISLHCDLFSFVLFENETALYIEWFAM